MTEPQPAANPTDQVINQNQRLFNKYAQILSRGDPEIFVTHAKKLATWLSDFKAYYAAARPEIVKLLLIAQLAVKANLRIQDSQAPFYTCDYPNDPMVMAYERLVAAVEPFAELFCQEPGYLDYAAHVHAIVETIRKPYTPPAILPQNQLDFDKPSAQHITAGGMQIQSSVPPQASQQHYTSDPDIMIIERPPNFQDSKPAQFAPASGNSTSARPAGQIPKVKVKKRKTIDFNVLVNYDLKGLEEKQGAKSSGVTDVAKRTIKEQSSIAQDPSLPVEESKPDTPIVSHQDSNTGQDDGEKEHLPQKQGDLQNEPITKTDTPMLDTQSTIEPVTLPEEVVATASIKRDDHQQSMPVISPSNVDNSIIQEEVLTTEYPHNIDNIDQPGFENIVPISRNDSIESGQILESGVEPTQSVQIHDSEGEPIKADQTTKNLTQAMRPVEPMDIDTDTSHAHAIQSQSIESGQILEVEVEPTNSGRIFDSGGEPVKADQTTKSLTPEPESAKPMDVDTDTSHAHANQSQNETPEATLTETLTTQPPPEQIPTHVLNESEQHLSTLSNVQKIGKFGPEMCIVTKQEGTPGIAQITIKFDLLDNQLKQISNWIQYQAGPDSEENALLLKQSLSLTLGCYLNDDLKEISQAADYATLEAQTSFSPSKWPAEGLSMKTMFNGNAEHLPLSPPLRVTPENLVDICPFSKVGTNEIILRQQLDLSQYIFVLHAHYPTKSQVDHVKHKWKKQKEWADWVQGVTRPLPFHFPP